MSQSSRRVSFPATLYLSVNAATGEEFLVRARAEVEEDARLARADYETALTARVSSGEISADGSAKLSLQFTAQQTTYLTRAVTDADAAREGAERLDFVLTKPTYGELEAIRSEATDYDFQAGGERWNERKYRRLLLGSDAVKQDGKTLSSRDVDELPVVVADDLGFRLARSIQPDQRRLLFTSPLV